MDKTKEIFALDADVFIGPYHQYYSFKIAPPYWDFLKEQISAGSIILLKVVADEFASKVKKDGGIDELSAWYADSKLPTIDHRKSDIITEYGNVVNHLISCGKYTTNAIATWTEVASVADPWLVAAGRARNYTIITSESLQTLSGRKKADKIKIPNICNHLGVKWKNLFYMLDEMGFHFTGHNYRK